MKRQVISYLQNGDSYTSIFDLEKTQPRHLNTEFSTNEFTPFENERHIGRLVTIYRNKLNNNFKQPFSQLPYLSERTRMTPIGDRNRKSILKELQQDMVKDDEKNFLIRTKLDQLTKYVTSFSNEKFDQKGCQFQLYRVVKSKVEEAQNSNKLKKYINKHPLLVGKKQNSVPALGIYSPQPVEKHVPRVLIKNMKPIIVEKKELITETSNGKSCKRTSIQGSSDDNFEVLYARTINQINRTSCHENFEIGEVEKDRSRNPYQFLHPRGELTMKETLTIEEAQEYRNLMKQNFKLMKESLNRIKNLMNMKK